MQQLSVSFIIPAYNEELFLPQVLKNIGKYMPTELSYEVIVADNGSEDKTVEFAEDAGAKVIVNKEATIGGLRNLAVGLSRGRVLVFLDADVLLTRLWKESISEVYSSIITTPKMVTGSRCGVPENASWIESVWFKPLVNKSAKYINSGHMIVSRELFDMVGGFDASLETGEDYGFSQAALKVNAVIVSNPSLAVVHEGYPKTIYQFLRREMWHGRGDCESLRSIASSKVAAASVLFAFLHLIAVTGLLVQSNIVVAVAMLIVLFMCVSASVYKHNARTVKDLVLVSFLYYLYFISRLFSCVSFMSVRSVKRKDGFIPT